MSKFQQRESRKRVPIRNIFVSLAVVVVLVVGAAYWRFRIDSPQESPAASTPVASQTAASQAMSRGEYEKALAICLSLLDNDANSASVLMMAGECATRLQQFDEAIQLYNRIPDSAGNQAALARWATGEIYFHLGKPTPAIDVLQASLQLNPDLAVSHDRLLSLLNTCGRRRETQPHLMALMRQNQMTIERLLYLGNLTKQYEDLQELKRFQKSSSNDLLPNLGLAQILRADGEPEAAAVLLHELIAQRQELVEAHVQLGYILLDAAEFDFSSWNFSLPSSAELHPDVWFIRGQWIATQRDLAGATRCFAEAIRLDPNHLPAHIALAQHLQKLNKDALAAPFTEKAAVLQKFNLAMEQLWNSREHEAPLRDAAELAFLLGRYWESAGWCAYAQGLYPQAEWSRVIASKIQALGPFNLNWPQTMPDANLIANANWLADFPIPSFVTSTDTGKASDRDALAMSSNRVKFEDIIHSAGVSFTYYNSHDATQEGRRMFELFGGGIGVLDFDMDGRQDLFLAQGTEWPPTEVTSTKTDQIFRNLGLNAHQQLRFQEVSSNAYVRDWQYGQGIAVGDLNSDGFDDVYVCNVGENQLWINQGDGTFIDGSLLLPDSEAQWTVSAAIGDLNCDGLPEIYDANYVEGEDVFTRRCPIAGKPRACAPLVFSPAKHRLLVPTEDGRYHEFAGSGADEMRGYGLGVVMFRMAEERLPRIFVAIDQQANLLLQITETESSAGFALQNEALFSGIALDDAGRAQACMGIAAGDANQDGRVDLFITNFYEEYNTLYVQDEGLFRDVSARVGLVASSMPMLGFGTQFVDFELDGWPDLAVLNGHIDDQTHIGIPERMRPQLLVNRNGERFEELPAGAGGTFFESLRLGRGLATADLDNDGLTDLICSDLELPLSILRNASTTVGEFVNVTLVGSRSDRSAYFTEVTLSGMSMRAQTQQLVAGGGYLVSNQRRLQFSVPADGSHLRLKVNWPSGEQEQFADIEPGKSYLIIEGQGIFDQ